MEDLYPQSTTDKKKLIQRICKMLSNAYDMDLRPEYFGDGTMCIVDNENYEIVQFKIKELGNIYTMFFFMSHCINMMLDPLTEMRIRFDTWINTSKVLGSNLAELMINLDLMKNVKS